MFINLIVVDVMIDDLLLLSSRSYHSSLRLEQKNVPTIP